MRTSGLRSLALVSLLALAACSSGAKTATQPSSSASTSSSASSSGSSAEPSSGGADWVTWGRDSLRSGVTDDGPGRDGLHQAWQSDQLDGDVYAEPLVVGRDVIVVTENNSVYAFDARTGAPHWQTLHLGDPVDGASLPCGNVDPVGITSTPVADPSTNRLYVVGMMQPAHHELFALALDTGAVQFHRTVDAAGSQPEVQNQRGALALANEKVYVPFGGRFGDCGDYKGRVVAVAADGTGNPIEYTVRANRQAGFWAPAGPVVDKDGTLLVTSGNSDGTTDFDDGNAVIRLSPDLQRLDEFAPVDWPDLNARDRDVGTTSPAVLDNGLVFQAGKTGIGYVLDAAHFGDVGGELYRDTVCGDSVFGGFAHDGNNVLVPCGDELKLLSVTRDSFGETWSATVANAGPPIIANNLVWVLDVGAGVVHALDRATGNAVFDANVGALTHFSPPAAGDGTVFVAGGRRVEAFASGGGGTPVP